MSAIPCLSYRRALEDEKKLKESLENENTETEVNGEKQLNIDEDNKPALVTACPYANADNSNGNNDPKPASNDTTNVVESDGTPPPAKKPRVFGAFSNAKIETVKENLKEQSLTVHQINDYCKNLFIFKNIRVMRFT